VHGRHLPDPLDEVRNDNEHYQATSASTPARSSSPAPSIGSWVSYGLGTLNQNLPSFVAIPPHLPYAGTQIFNNDFLPAYHQGVRVIPGKEPIANLDRRTNPSSCRNSNWASPALNRRHLNARGHDSDLAARIRTFETAFHMQTEAREVFDLSRESDATLALYGMKRGQTDGFGWQCLSPAAWSNAACASSNWSTAPPATTGTSTATWPNTPKHAKNIDQPIAGLLQDLASAACSTTPWSSGPPSSAAPPASMARKGRGHHSACFSSWLAGGGVKGGLAYGSTDESAPPSPRTRSTCTTSTRPSSTCSAGPRTLTFRHGGRDYRLTDVHGHVVQALLA
jgi:hypothetical protein